MRILAPWSAVAAAGLVVAGIAAPAWSQTPPPRADRLLLPAPVGQIPLVAPEVVTPERRRTTFVPGPVADDEQIAVRLQPDGTPAKVTVTQRLELTGTGDFAIRERGPALRVTALDGTTAPIIQRGTVVWQGFVPGRRLLAADLELDPAREALLLPLRVEIEWRGVGGSSRLQPGGVAPEPGRLVARLINQTARPEQLPTADVPADVIAGPLDMLRRSASGPADDALPTAGRGLPRDLPAGDLGSRPAVVSAPLRVTGSLTVAGVTGVLTSGPGATPTASGDGAAVDGVLEGSTEIALEIPAAGAVRLDLTVRTALDPRRLNPPGDHESWATWAATDPTAAARRAAVDQLVAAAAATARADEVAPYLGHPGPGQTTTRFDYTLAAAAVVRAPKIGPTPRPVPIALTALGLLGLLGGARLAWRRL